MTDQAADTSPEALTERFVRLLEVEPVEQNFFRGMATPGGRGRAFGGQVIAQALMAAHGTVEDGKSIHSLHAYFMRPGDAAKPVLYRVERDFDGRSFSTRRVIAIQDGRPILNFAGSFHVAEEGFAHHVQMPDVPPPEELESELELIEKYGDRLPETFRSFARTNRPVELRPTALRQPFVVEPQPPEHSVWFRALAPMGGGVAMQRAALAYVSDMGLLSVAAAPSGRGFGTGDMMFASLDHAMWFHDDFQMEEWLLFAQESPWAGGARGYTRGFVFTRDGRLVASVAQEGLIRPIEKRED